MWRNNQDESTFGWNLWIFSAHQMIPASTALNTSGKKCGFVSVEVTNPKPTTTRRFLGGVKKKKLFSGQLLSCTRQSHRSSQTGAGSSFAQPALVHLQRLVSSRCKNHKLPPRRKGPGQADDYIKRTGSPSVTTGAKRPVPSLTPARFVIVPARAPSLRLLSAHSSRSVSLDQSQSPSLPCWHSLSLVLFRMSPIPLPLWQDSETPLGLSDGTSVRAAYYRHQSQSRSEDVRCCVLSVCFALPFKTAQKQWKELNKVVLGSTWFIDCISTEKWRRLSGLVALWPSPGSFLLPNTNILFQQQKIL